MLDEHQTVSRPSDKVGPLQAVAVGPDETVVPNASIIAAEMFSTRSWPKRGSRCAAMTER